MNDDHRELARRLFVAATELLEDALEASVQGQAPKLDPAELVACARRLRTAARDVAAIAEAVAVCSSCESRGLRSHE